MPRNFSRTRRVEEQLRRDLADLIRSEVKEPDLGLLSISEARVTRDLAHAKIFVSILQDDPEVVKYTMDVLRHYAGRLRSHLGKRMHIRTVPQLDFIYDDLIKRGTVLHSAIESAVNDDHEKDSRFGTQENDDKEKD